MEPPLTQDYFALFDLPPAFDIDSETLTARYRRLQHLVHPDRYSAAGEQERRLAAQRAALINEAYETLKKPLSRARHLLVLRGVDPQQRNTVDPEFLMEQMHLRERLAELRASRSLDSLSALLDDIEHRCRDAQRRLAEALTTLENEETACRRYHELQFLERLREEALDLEEHLYGA